MDDRINLIKKQEHPQTTKAHREVVENPRQQHRLQNTRHTSLYSPTTGHESHRNSQKVDSAVRESAEQGVFPAGFDMTVELHAFSARSKKLITDMGITEIFELCETSSEIQCHDCALYWQIGIVYCSCGRSLKLCEGPNCSTRRTLTPYQFPVTSSKRASPMVLNMELPKGNECTTQQRRGCRRSPTQAW